jgi:uncharacterized protein YrzB (UPF0473 family)
MNEDNYVTLTDDEGNEVLYEILFAVDKDENPFGKNYLVLTEPGAGEKEDPEEEVEILAFEDQTQDDATEGELIPIESEEEWNMIAELLNTLVADDSLTSEDNEEN